MRATRYPYLNLSVDPADLSAIALYRRSGFAEIGEHDHVLKMRLRLQSSGHAP